MWEAGGIHGSHEAALLLQAAAGRRRSGDHALLPWPAVPPPPYMMMPTSSPMPFGAVEMSTEASGPFGAVGPSSYYDQGGGPQYGLFGLQDPSSSLQQHAMNTGDGAAGPSSRMVVSGLLGSLQAELGRMTAKEIMDAKALAASRSHSEAERRRRQRINSHMARLRSLLPNTTKTDKASLLAEVIEHVKELKRQTSAMMGAAGDQAHGAAAAVQMLPTEADELEVDVAADDRRRLVVRASLCCEDRPDLIPDIARALAALRLRARRAEIATLGGRVRNVLLITQVEEDEDDDDDGGCFGAASHRAHELVASIQEALRGVMDNKAAAAASSDTTSSSGAGGGGSIKRQRMNAAQEQASF